MLSYQTDRGCNVKQISIRLDDALHKEVRHLLIEIEKSFNEYVLELIRKDLEQRKIEK